MSQLDDWNRCNELYCDWMYFEAVESGYDARSAHAAQKIYLKAFVEYEKIWGIRFNPERKPVIDDSFAQMSASSEQIHEFFGSGSR